jgi:hypothetical protein
MKSPVLLENGAGEIGKSSLFLDEFRYDITENLQSIFPGPTQEPLVRH